MTAAVIPSLLRIDINELTLKATKKNSDGQFNFFPRLQAHKKSLVENSDYAFILGGEPVTDSLRFSGRPTPALGSESPEAHVF